MYRNAAPRLRSRKEKTFGEDRISGLPEDILVAILSLLTLKEAGRTSVLSLKWRYLWTLITRRLDFDGWTRLDFDGWDERMEMSLLQKEKRLQSSAYVRWVNQVLYLHRGPCVDEFRIYYDLEPSDYIHVENWIKFAFEKQVKKLELDLIHGEGYKFQSFGKYWSTRSKKIKYWSSSDTAQGMAHAVRSSLTTLRLMHVDVNGKVIEYFLANCPLLEELHVAFSNSLQKLKVADVALKLKSLEISSCWRFTFLEICAINLVRLSYTGLLPIRRLLLSNAPALSKFTVDGRYCESLMYEDHLDSSLVRQMEELHMKFVSNVFQASRSFPREFPQLCRLKQLELEIRCKVGDNLVIYTCLIKACPSLTRFAMRYTRGLSSKLHESSLLSSDSSEDDESSSSEDEPDYLDGGASAQKAFRFQHQCLKVVELVGFMGHAKDLELASHLLKVAVSLDKLVINPRRPYFADQNILVKPELLEEGRKCARLLETKLPPGASLVVL